MSFFFNFTVLVLLMIVVCWGPHFALLLVETDATYRVPDVADSMALVLIAMSPVLSPVLYAFRYDKNDKNCLSIKERTDMPLSGFEIAS